MSVGADKDPSMEEILASIKRIITDEDAPPGTLAVPEPAPVDGARFADAGDVLELTDPLPEARLQAQPESVQARPVPAAPAGAETVASQLISEQTAAAASRSLEALSSLVVRDYEGAENTLEGLVREMLRPMLREWLDVNLPEIVERTVAREIARITRRD